VTVVPYDPDWARSFEAERELLKRVLAPWLVGGVHHVGSTAVPGLASKPIIDMIAGVGDFEEARSACQPLAEHGYIHAPHRPGIAHHFAKPSARLSECTHGLHLTEVGSDLWLERFAFRDALLADPSLVEHYEALKVRLAAEHSDSAGDYTTGKREFVALVLATRGIEPGRR
jgi:GrpB-like predicted nucleotidyltransferase (UPF0157 family)